MKILHGKQAFTIFRPLADESRVRGDYEIVAVEEKGVVLHVVKRLSDVKTGERLAKVTTTYMLRGDGGQGGFGQPRAPRPEREADIAVDTPTLPQAALIYRLSGDYNPNQGDPEAAAKGGFPPADPARAVYDGRCDLRTAGRRRRERCRAA